MNSFFYKQVSVHRFNPRNSYYTINIAVWKIGYFSVALLFELFELPVKTYMMIMFTATQFVWFRAF